MLKNKTKKVFEVPTRADVKKQKKDASRPKGRGPGQAGDRKKRGLDGLFFCALTQWIAFGGKIEAFLCALTGAKAAKKADGAPAVGTRAGRKKSPEARKEEAVVGTRAGRKETSGARKEEAVVGARAGRKKSPEALKGGAGVVSRPFCASVAAPEGWERPASFQRPMPLDALTNSSTVAALRRFEKSLQTCEEGSEEALKRLQDARRVEAWACVAGCATSWNEAEAERPLGVSESLHGASRETAPCSESLHGASRETAPCSESLHGVSRETAPCSESLQGASRQTAPCSGPLPGSEKKSVPTAGAGVAPEADVVDVLHWAAEDKTEFEPPFVAFQTRSPVCAALQNVCEKLGRFSRRAGAFFDRVMSGDWGRFFPLFRPSYIVMMRPVKRLGPAELLDFGEMICRLAQTRQSARKTILSGKTHDVKGGH